MNSSIRQRLLLWLSPTLLLAGVIFAVPTWFNIHEEIDELFDQVLRETAYSQLNSTSISNSNAQKQTNPPAVHDIDLISQKWSSDGRLLYRSHPFPALPAPIGEGLSTVYWQGETWRVFNLKTSGGLIQIAQSISERRQTANEIASHLLTPLVVLLPALALLIWFGLIRGLRPLQKVVDALEQRTPDSLRPIPDRELPHEVSTLVSALNRLLYRLDEALASQRQFTADAAHELRSPLTALSLQAQVLERAIDPHKRSLAIKTLRQGIARASHLVHQLLTLARLDPDAPQHPFTPLRLDELTRTVVGDYAPLAADRGIDLGLVAADATQVFGDDQALRVLLGNLLDNAIRYTSAGGRVDVSVLSTNGKARLEVNDEGPGIPDAERGRVFDRFYRVAGNAEAGSGLGLAIVKRIADRHGASIRLAEGAGGRGLTVSVSFCRRAP
jgi:two-component system OmpR family sensor kinase